MLEGDVVADGDQATDISDDVLSHRSSHLKFSNLHLLVESDALSNIPSCEHARASLDDGTRAFPTWRERVLHLDVVLATHEEDVTGVEDRTVHLDEKLVGTRLLNR